MGSWAQEEGQQKEMENINRKQEKSITKKNGPPPSASGANPESFKGEEWLVFKVSESLEYAAIC